MANGTSVLGRLTGFTLLPLIGLVLPLVLLPTVASIVGKDGWSSAVAGTAIGTFAATLILWGWNVDGPVLVARSSVDAERADLYARSVRSRVLVAAIVVPLCCVVAAVNALPGFATASMAMMLASALAGFSPAWFGIGLGSPRMLALFETLPRVLGTLAAIPLMVLSRSVWPYPILVGAATVLSLSLFARRYAPGRRWWPAPLGEVVLDLKRQRHTAAYNLAGAAYAATPVPVANATIRTSEIAAFGSADQLYRYGLFTVVALGNALQAWTLEPSAPNARRRHLSAIAAHTGLGIAGVAVLALAGPPVGAILFGADKAPTLELCLIYGFAFLFISVATPLSRNLLIPAGRQALVLHATVWAAVLGVALMVTGGVLGRLDAIAVGMAASEALVVALLVRPAHAVLRVEGTEPPA